MNIIVINGPNLNLLGKRDKNIYGSLTLTKIQSVIKKEFPKDKFVFFQSNIEGEIVTKIQTAEKKFEGVIINSGGYAHTSVAIRDALADSILPKVEVHLSNLSSREDFRQVLITASVCDGYISGFKENSYTAAVYLLHKIINKKKRKL
jgi:3-dehydroquinate dehydratase II